MRWNIVVFQECTRFISNLLMSHTTILNCEEADRLESGQIVTYDNENYYKVIKTIDNFRVNAEYLPKIRIWMLKREKRLEYVKIKWCLIPIEALPNMTAWKILSQNNGKSVIEQFDESINNPR